MTGWKKVSDHGQPPIGAYCRMLLNRGEWFYFVADEDPSEDAYVDDCMWFVPELPAYDDIEPPPAPTIPPQ